MNTKRCTKCEKTYPRTLEHWQKSSHSKDGLQHWCRQCTRQYARDNREHYNKYHAEYRKANHEKRAKQDLIDQAIRRERKRKLVKDFTPSDWQRALNYFNGCCAVCGRPLADLFGTRTASYDHWIPVVSPDCPGTIPTNIVPLCSGLDGCNQSKGSKIADEWLVEKFGKRKAAQILKRVNAYFYWINQHEQAA